MLQWLRFHPLMTEDLTTDLLKAVSRSFYLSMYWLPPVMRRGISLGYLLARATDSVADTSTAPAAQRAEALRQMGAAVEGSMEAAAERQLLSLLRGEMARAQHNPAESRLLQRFGEALAALRACSQREQELVRRVLATIVKGQLWDISYFESSPAVTSDEQTLEYTYMVAGCVGEFWTELGYATLGDDFADASRRELMVQAAVRYGRGLQLVNILRDAGEDAARGRSYLCTDRSRWFVRAERYLADGVDYSRRLRGFRLRFASMLPALIGQKTLRLLRRHETVQPGGQKVKIARRAVYACLLKAVGLSILRRDA